MDDKASYWASVGLSAFSLLLLVTNVALVNSNRTLQNELNQRQAVINQGMNLSQLNQNLVQALGDASVKNDDKQIRDLLASQGITVKANPAAEQPKKK